VDTSAVLGSLEDLVIDEAVAALAQTDQARRSPLPDERRRDVRQLFHLVLRCVRAGRAKPIIRPSEQIAAYSYAAGIDLTEVQEASTSSPTALHAAHAVELADVVLACQQRRGGDQQNDA
jgi:hypothetical protein